MKEITGRLCRKCGIPRPLSAWKKCKSTLNGRYYFRAYCNPCLNKKRNELHRKRQDFTEWKKKRNSAYINKKSNSLRTSI